MSNSVLEKPFPPADGECCESGSCQPCVWDNYYTELQKWRIEQAKLNEQVPTNSGV
ncbi:oxidoreductase-like domain-containing protein [Thalassotalea agarivorans]|uniref:Oxidoreductase-like protein, N-terminal n=1 Tax=Thalassotalea agarivorans TaxID=349064 RepID=A0A1I0GIQ3_THASX|nr:oxidoreductase-like domain-containing protein [Thalassotalea agarivorans]SET70806.1 Oxidoreductase-like protein, N-terminal [Thalassotalea agarivorans]